VLRTVLQVLLGEVVELGRGAGGMVFGGLAGGEGILGGWGS
jgi:hypothetical protein